MRVGVKRRVERKSGGRVAVLSLIVEILSGKDCEEIER